MIATQLESRMGSYSLFQNTKINHVVIVFLGSIFIALAAQISIPLNPVPITLQSFAALFIGMMLGPKLSSEVILAYLAEGICGLPVFANFSWGLSILLGPTGGYLIGFIFVVVLTGYLLQNGWAQYRMTTFLAALFGDIVLFILGFLRLSFFIGFHKAYLLGVAPFYLIEIIKLLLLAFIIPLFWKIKTFA